MPAFPTEQILIDRAEAGDPYALFEMAVSIEESALGDADLRRAADYYRRAATRGHLTALNNLCLMAVRSDSVVSVSREEWGRLEELGRSGDREAQNTVGLGHFYGEAADFDYELAREWYTRSAEGGCAAAQFNLGGIWFEAKGVDRDLDKAVTWYSRAAQSGHELALVQLGSMHEKGLGVEKNLALALTLYSCALRRHSKRAAIHLGIMYAKGKEISQDLPTAYALFERSLELRDNADNGTLHPSYIENALYWLGHITEQSPALGKRTALYWYGRGADAGSDLCAKQVERLKRESGPSRARRSSRRKH
ncbi:hypothetical protein SAMN05421819_0756 [Bryocella elongata]|uniref:TPR repeat n=1 Tax=Bryocella elongata TaxID=863522 RepID=A0A1H5TVK6_9BACT|nr:tetratricopeptide repeat protein [Bryocella elongata]SEF66833.1 hypothetical protein SAMN05421819_0756 [Bryocella elongata]